MLKIVSPIFCREKSSLVCTLGSLIVILRFSTRVQTKEDFFRQKMGLTIFNIDLTNLKIPLQTSFYIFERLRIS